MAPVLLPSCVVVFGGKRTGIVKGLRGGWALSGSSTLDLDFFGFSHCWVFSWVFGRCFLFVVSFMYILLYFSAPGRLVRVLDQGFFFLPQFPPPRGWVGLGGSLWRP